jgi:hypothetical protein
MGVQTSEVGYTSAKTGRGGHEVHKGHVVALKKMKYTNSISKNTVLALRGEIDYSKELQALQKTSKLGIALICKGTKRSTSTITLHVS